MKIKVKEKTVEYILNLPPKVHKRPKKSSFIFRSLIRVLSNGELKAVNFSYKKVGMEKLKKNEPCLYLMNHSCFLDMKIASHLIYPRPFNIVTTTDGFIGKAWLMKKIGCIPTDKFVAELELIRDIVYTVKNLKSSVLLYPEAGYSIDGTNISIGESIGKFIKFLNVPVVMIKTYGAFLYQPLYNSLIKRKVKVSAKMEYIISPEDIKNKTAKELYEIVCKHFDFDELKWQQENQIKIDHPKRAEGLNKILYKCPDCLAEGEMATNGEKLFCKNCGKEYSLSEYGKLIATDGVAKFNHIPDWFKWQRKCVAKEISDGAYSLDIPVDVYVSVDYKALYSIGTARLTHGLEGFKLNGSTGLEYAQKPLASHSVNTDFFFYEIGDVIAIGSSDITFYCFPKNCGDVVTKVRLATEELYKIIKGQLAK